MPDRTSSYSVGWSVFGRTFGSLVPRDRRRRAYRIGAIVAATAAVVAVVLGVLLRWPDLGSPAGWAGCVLAAAGLGGFGAACVPLLPRPSGTERLSWSGTVMQAPERSERYFRPRAAPTIDARDRDEVLHDADLLRGLIVPDVFRMLLVIPAGLALVIGLALLDAHLQLIGFVSVALVVRLVVSVTRLGRIERARLLADSLPDVPRTDGRRGSAPGPAGGTTRPPGRLPGAGDRPGTGSKLGLPGE